MTVGVSPRAPRGGEKLSKVANRQHRKIGGYDSHPTKVRVEAKVQPSRGETGGEAEAAKRRRRGDEEATGEAREHGMC